MGNNEAEWGNKGELVREKGRRKELIGWKDELILELNWEDAIVEMGIEVGGGWELELPAEVNVGV